MFPRYDDIVAAVPAYDRYLLLDELEASTDALRSPRTRASRSGAAGASRDGHEIRCLEVGGGPLRAAARRRASSRGARRHPRARVPPAAAGRDRSRRAARLRASRSSRSAIPTVCASTSPGSREPGDLAGFLLRQYRPPSVEQFEWTFPFEYKRYGFAKPLPEARAVMEVVDRAPARPLHGPPQLRTSAAAYFYLSHDDAALRGELSRCSPRRGCRPTVASPRCPTCTAFGDGVFEAFDLADDYEYYPRYGVDPAVALHGGTSSDAYAEAVWDCFTLVAEVPYFTSPKAADLSAGGLDPGARPRARHRAGAGATLTGCTSAT